MALIFTILVILFTAVAWAFIIGLSVEMTDMRHRIERLEEKAENVTACCD